MAKDYGHDPKLVHKFYDRARIKHLQRIGLLGKPDSVVLDVGCSTGMFLRVLRDRGYQELVGQEFSDEQADFCRQEHKFRVVTSISELTELHFDLVTMYAVLEHVRDVSDLITSVCSVVKDGGHIIIDVPNASGWYQVFSKESWLWLIPPAHLHYFTPQSLERLLEANGFVVVEKRSVSTSTWVFILAHHVYSLFGRQLPGTSLSSSWFRRKIIWLIEGGIRLVLAPISWAAQKRMRHNQLIYVAAKL